MSAEFDQLVAQFERFQSKIKRMDQQFEQVGQLQQDLAGLEATAASPDRTVTVVAGPSGSIKDIRLADAALRQSPQALSAALMTTLRQAVAEAARRQAVLVEGAFGDDMRLTDQVLETQAQLFGTTPEELRASMAQAPEARPAAEPEDLSEENFLRREDRPSPPPPHRQQRPDDGRYLNLYDDEDR